MVYWAEQKIIYINTSKENSIGMKTTLFDNNIARFALEIDGEVRKILYYFIQKDGSIGLGTYFPTGGSAAIETDNIHQTHKVKDILKQYSDFIPQKTSFHISGKIVVKDRAGNRRSHDNDIQSLSFKSIVDPIQLRVVYPSYFYDYTLVKEKEIINTTTWDIIFPVMIKIFLCPNSYDFESWMINIDKESIIYEDCISLNEFNLAIYTVIRKSNNLYTPDVQAIADTKF